MLSVWIFLVDLIGAWDILTSRNWRSDPFRHEQFGIHTQTTESFDVNILQHNDLELVAGFLFFETK